MILSAFLRPAPSIPYVVVMEQSVVLTDPDVWLHSHAAAVVEELIPDPPSPHRRMSKRLASADSHVPYPLAP
jgi:hypothetical protein